MKIRNKKMIYVIAVFLMLFICGGVFINSIIPNNTITVEAATLFFASPFWTKLQNIFGHCCMSKLDKVAKHMASLEQTSRTALQTL